MSPEGQRPAIRALRIGQAAACIALTLSTTGFARLRQDRSGPTAAILERVGERVRSYYERLITIACTEVVTQQDLKSDLTPRGKVREFVYDVIVTRERADSGDGRVGVRAERQIRTRNGRPARKNDRSGCTDPRPVYTDPLIFLLPENRPDFTFTLTSETTPAVQIEFAQRAAEPTTVTWTDNCFHADGGRLVGRVTVDRVTDDVMELETRLGEPFKVALPAGGRRVVPGPDAITIERVDAAVRFSRIPFDDPPETLLLPESIVTITTIRGASTPRVRTTQTFSGYKRFFTTAKVKGGY